MKTTLKKMLGLAALSMSLLNNTVPTWAGSVTTPEVAIGGNQTYSSAKRKHGWRALLYGQHYNTSAVS